MTTQLTGPLELVASYDSYGEAQRAVDALADRRFPVERLTIVTSDLRIAEQVTGRLGYLGAIGQGALSGAFPSAIFGFILGLFGVITPLVSGLTLALWGLVIGAVIGGLVGLFAHAAMGGRRDFSSVSGLRAVRYDLMGAVDVVAEARRLISAPRVVKSA